MDLGSALIGGIIGVAVGFFIAYLLSEVFTEKGDKY